MRENICLPANIEIAILLPRKGGRWKIFCRGARSYRICSAFSELCDLMGDLSDELGGHRSIFNNSSYFCAQCTDLVSFIRFQSLQLFTKVPERLIVRGNRFIRIC